MPSLTDTSLSNAIPLDSHAPAPSSRDTTVVAPPQADAGADAPKFAAPNVSGDIGKLGKFRVIKELGRGGMGVVYLAGDTLLNRKLALKVMLPKFAADARAKDRFLLEARAAAGILHDNVVRVYEADELNGVPYIAMELLTGGSLDRYMTQNRSPALPLVLRIGCEVAEGLAAAHAAGLIHRDIKPANLWIEEANGRAKVLDFGLAKSVGADVEATKLGTVVGTPAYMSPEQARGDKVDHRTDLFSLGAVLYRLYAGKLPFDKSTVVAVLLSLAMDEPTPVRTRNPEVPESLAELIHQLLDKNPNHRPQTASEVATRLRAILEQPAAPAAPEAVLMAAAADDSHSMPIVVHTLPASAFANLPVTAPTRKKSSGKGALIAVSVAVLLAVIAVGIVIKIKHKDGSETEIKVPEGATVIVEKDGKPLIKVDPEEKAVPAGSRAAAEWVLGAGGKVTINTATGEREVKALKDLPPGAVTVTAVSLAGAGDKVTDDDLKRLSGLTELRSLDLSDTKTGDDGLKHVAGLKEITRLNLSRTNISGDGLAHLEKMKLSSLVLDGLKVAGSLGRLQAHKNRLTELSLNDTNVYGASLEVVGLLTKLNAVSVKKTKANQASIEKLAKALPGCKIEWDGGTVEPKK